MDPPDTELYKRAFLNTENPAVITDTNYVMVDVNDACVEFTGYDREELIGNVPLMLFSEQSVYREAIHELEAGRSWEGFFEAETKQGDLIYGRASITPLFVDGEKQGYSGIFVDLTDRRRYEQTLKVIHRVLRHDLRNETNLIQGYADTVADQLTDDELLGYLEELQDVTDRLIRRSRKARELEQVLYEGFEQPLQGVQVDTVLERVVARARETHDVEIQMGPIPSREVVANDLLDAVFEAVLENAVVHNDGHPRVEITARDLGDELAVNFADNGPGIPDPQKEQIFGREETNDVDHGEGFGLYFVDLVVETFGGDVRVTDNEMGGATFEIVLEKFEA